MARKGNAIHIPEDYSHKDMSRAPFDRQLGHVGLYLEVSDAEPIDAHAFGSHLYFLRQATEGLGDVMRDVTLERLKGEFERRDLCQDALFEQYCPENVVAVSFESVSSLEELWSLHEKDLLTPLFKNLYTSTKTLKTLKAKSLEVSVRMWDDEVDACKAELSEGRVAKIELAKSDKDKALIRRVKRYHSSLAEVILKVRDALTQFDKSLGEFIMIFKQNLPKDTEKISTYSEFLEHVDYVKKHKRSDVNMKVVDGYAKTRKVILDSIKEVEDNVLHPLLQVHASCEREYQRDLKKKMRNALKETKKHLQPDYDFYRLNHKEWQAKILQREQKLFLGLISALALSVDTILDLDTQTDEYMSSLEVSIKA